MIPHLATKTKTMTVSREKLVELIKAYQKKNIRWGGCPTHEEVIAEYLQEIGLWFDKLEAVGSYKGYIVHYHDRCPWAR